MSSQLFDNILWFKTSKQIPIYFLKHFFTLVLSDCSTHYCALPPVDKFMTVVGIVGPAILSPAGIFLK